MTVEEDAEIQAKENMLFGGTAIANGTCTAVVTATGMGTEMGKIQSQIHAAGAEEQETPLKKKLNAFGEMLAQVLLLVLLSPCPHRVPVSLKHS